MKNRAKSVILATVVLAGLLCLVSPAMADRVVDMGNVPREGTVQGITDRGIVLLWSATNSERVFPFAQVKSIAADGVTELEQADLALFAGEAAKAAELYERAARRNTKPWVKEYINARLVQAYGDSRKLDQAVNSYVALLQARSALAAQVRMPAIGNAKGREADAALAAIDAALTAHASNKNVERLKEVKISLLVERGDPKDVLPMIEAQLKSNDVALREQARLKQIELFIQIGDADSALKSIALARTEIDAVHQPQLYFSEGRSLYLKEDYPGAALSFMRIPLLFGLMQKNLAADALVWTARCLEKSGAAVSEIHSVLQEAVQDFGGTSGAEEAAKMLSQMSAQQQR